MNRKKLVAAAAIGAVAGVASYRIGKYIKKKKAEIEAPTIPHRQGFYERYIKRPQDFCCTLLAIIVLSPVMLGTALLVRIKLGSPVLFTQERPGMIDPDTGKEQIFKLYKFRTMTDARDENGELLPDEERLTEFGKWLRSTSLDELPELFNILRGDMAVVGPRPLLVRDMVFMTDKQRQRHLVKPGLSGLAQINGRNSISWEEKLEWDQRYIKKITFFGDWKIIMDTFRKAFIEKDGINREGTASDLDYGDWLLQEGRIDREKYDGGKEFARRMLNRQQEKGIV